MSIFLSPFFIGQTRKAGHLARNLGCLLDFYARTKRFERSLKNAPNNYELILATLQKCSLHRNKKRRLNLSSPPSFFVWGGTSPPNSQDDIKLWLGICFRVHMVRFRFFIKMDHYLSHVQLVVKFRKFLSNFRNFPSRRHCAISQVSKIRKFLIINT